jgi:hypothetical protein
MNSRGRELLPETKTEVNNKIREIMKDPINM